LSAGFILPAVCFMKYVNKKFYNYLSTSRFQGHSNLVVVQYQNLEDAVMEIKSVATVTWKRQQK